MARLRWAVATAAGLGVVALTSPLPSFAQEPSSPEEIDVLQPLFPWAFREGGLAANWPEGVVLFLLGMVGALITIYLFAGELLPSMGGRTEYDLAKTELQDLKERRDQALRKREELARGAAEPNEGRMSAEERLVTDYENAIDRLEKQIGKERWQLFWIGFPVYLLLGGFFAAAFALNLLQALLIGFGWTAIADRIGLRKEEGTRRKLKATEIERIEQNYNAMTEELERTRRDRRALEVRSTQLHRAVEGLAQRAASADTPREKEVNRDDDAEGEPRGRQARGRARRRST